MDRVLAALETYDDWAESNTEYKFANYLNVSESYVRRALRLLILSDEIEKITRRPAPRINQNIYRIKSLKVRPRPCTVELTDVGWWLTFPHDRSAGLLIDSDSAKMQFAKACEVDLDDRDLLLALDLGEITDCPEEYYQLAKTFRETTFCD